MIKDEGDRAIPSILVNFCSPLEIMTIDEAIHVVDTMLVSAMGEHLHDIDIAILRSVWDDLTYAEMSEVYHWSEKTLKARGALLWRRLSRASGEQVGKKNIRAAVERWSRRPNHANPSLGGRSTSQFSPSTPVLDWGNAPDVPSFFGRTNELKTLEQRVLHHRDRLVAIVGMAGVGKTGLSIRLGKGGIGKTNLSLTLARGIQDEFEVVTWRSLLDAPPIEELLSDLIQVVSRRQETDRPTGLHRQISTLLEYLRQHRCLIILDNWETISQVSPIEASEHTPDAHLAGYGQLLRMVGEVSHQSCVLITSRETPAEVARLVNHYPVYRLPLGGLDQPDGYRIFAEIGAFTGSASDWDELIQFYDGNPLALEIVARHIHEVFAGNISDFLKAGNRIFDDLEDLLEWHVQRLSPLEQDLLYWLAINREPTHWSELREDVVSPRDKVQVPRTLEQLQRRLPVEKVSDRWALQPVLIEYLTQRVIQHVCEEIETGQPNVLITHALLKTQGKDYVKATQVRLILTPIQIDLQSRFRLPALEAQIKRILSDLKTKPTVAAGYGAGNLINLSIHLGLSLAHFDFSHLPIWQADLQSVSLQHTNFTRAQFSNSVFARILASIYAVTSNPAGDLLAIGDMTNTIRVCRTVDGYPLRLLEGHTRWIKSLAFSPNGQWLASGAWDSTVRLWDVETGQCLHIFRGHTQTVYSVAFSPTGDRLASGSYDGTIRLWDLHTGDCLLTIQGSDRPPHVVFSVCFSPDGMQIISANGDTTIKIWHPETGECLHVLDELAQSAWSVVISANGDWLACGCFDGAIWMWNRRTDHCCNISHAHQGLITSMALSQNGRVLASGSSDDTVKLWDTTTGQLLHCLRGHKAWVWSVALISEADVLVSGSVDQTVRLWDVPTGRCLKVIRGYYNLVFALTFVGGVGLPERSRSVSKRRSYRSFNRYIVSANDHCNDSVLRLWDTKTGRCVRVFHGHTRWIMSVIYLPSPLAASQPSKNHAQASELKQFSDLPGGLLISSSQDRTIRVWNVVTGRCINTWRGHDDSVFGIALSPDGQHLASTSMDRTVKLWDISTGECLKTLYGHQDTVYAVAFLSNGKMMASAGMESTIRLWDRATGRCLGILEGHTDWIWTMAASPVPKDGADPGTSNSYLATGSHDTTVRLWDAETRECLHVLRGHTNWVPSVTFSPDGQMLASASHDRTVRIWDVQTGDCLQVLQAPQIRLISVAFSPDGNLIAGSGEDEIVFLWRIESGELVQTLQVDRMYEGMSITGATGLTPAQREALIAFGAVD